MQSIACACDCRCWIPRVPMYTCVCPCINSSMSFAVYISVLAYLKQYRCAREAQILSRPLSRPVSEVCPLIRPPCRRFSRSGLTQESLGHALLTKPQNRGHAYVNSFMTNIICQDWACKRPPAFRRRVKRTCSPTICMNKPIP